MTRPCKITYTLKQHENSVKIRTDRLTFKLHAYCMALKTNLVSCQKKHLVMKLSYVRVLLLFNAFDRISNEIQALNVFFFFTSVLLGTLISLTVYMSISSLLVLTHDYAFMIQG